MSEQRPQTPTGKKSRRQRIVNKIQKIFHPQQGAHNDDSQSDTSTMLVNRATSPPANTANLGTTPGLIHGTGALPNRATAPNPEIPLDHSIMTLSRSTTEREELFKKRHLLPSPTT